MKLLFGPSSGWCVGGINKGDAYGDITVVDEGGWYGGCGWCLCDKMEYYIRL